MARSWTLLLGLSSVASVIALADVDDGPVPQQDEPRGLVFRLTEATPPPEAPPPEAPTSPLAPGEIGRVLSRLPPLPSDTTPDPGAVLRDPPRPPPRTGLTVHPTFPPPVERPAPEAPEASALEVVRYGPEGEADRGVQVSLTFSQPMVPVFSRAEVEAREVPARITPRSPGRWRWVGTRTLAFQPEPSLAMSTEYIVEVPAGVRSARGARLSEPVRWSFTTGRAEVTSFHPSRWTTVGRQPTMVALLDQDIHPDSVIAHVTVRAEGQTHPVRRATQEEVDEERSNRYSRLQLESDRWVAFRPRAPLPGGASVGVVFGAGTPSAEGPLRTDSAQSFEIRTYGPLAVRRSLCGYPRSEICRPGYAWSIRFSNRLDEEAFGDSLVRIEPLPPAADVEARSDEITIRSASEPRRKYRVMLDPRIRDRFGQTLGRRQTLTFDVGPAPRALGASGGRFVVLDPRGPPQPWVQTVNVESLRVRLYRVGPEEWPEFAERETSLWSRRGPTPEPPGRLVLSRTVEVDAEPDLQAATPIDPSPALHDGLGQAVLVVEPGDTRGESERMRPVYTWVQATRLGLDAIADRDEVVAWVNSLEDGRPIEGAIVTLLPDRRSARTDPDGLAKIAFHNIENPGTRVVVARRDDDVAMLPIAVDTSGGPELRWHVFTDRTLYRPGEDVHLKGWLRALGGGELDEPELPAGIVGEVTYAVRDGVGAELASGRAELNDLGGFDLAFTIPAHADLGTARIELAAGATEAWDGRMHTQRISVQEYRRPEFEVELEHDTGPFAVGDEAKASIAARYFAGGALPDAQVGWLAGARPGHFTPPNRDDFSFGLTTWWRSDTRTHERLESRTAADGRHAVRLEFVEADPPVPMRLDVRVTVLDVNRRSWTETASLLVHPASVYVGLKTERRFVRRGEPLTVQAIAVDWDGAFVAGRPLELRAVRIDWRWSDGEWQRHELDPQECEVVSAAVPVRCTFEANAGGYYIVRATTRDGEGRPTLSELPVWVGGGQWFGRPDADTADAVALLPDREFYQPGDTAEILVQAPFAPAEGVWTLRRAGVVRAERLRMDSASHVLRLPISEAYIPNLHLQVDLIPAGPIPADSAGHDVASGSVELSIPLLARTLRVKAEPRETRIEPGAETVIEVEVRDAKGSPAAGAEVAVVVVDEAVWALSAETVRSPVPAFYPPRAPGATGRHLRSSVLWRDQAGNVVTGAVFDASTGLPLAGANVYLEGMRQLVLSGRDGRYRLAVARPGTYTLVAERIGYGNARQRVVVSGHGAVVADFPLQRQAMEVQAAAVRARDPGSSMAYSLLAEAAPIALRGDFNPLAAFVPSAQTDTNGRAAVPVKVPGNLTRYRVIAVAAHGAREFGKGESALTVALPLMVRPSPPRFLHYGDRFDLSVVVQSTADSALTAQVAVRAANLDLAGPRGVRVTLPANGRAEVRFPAATVHPGDAIFQVAAIAGAATDAAQLAVPVRTPATVEAFATYGELDGGAAAIPVQPPGAALREFGGLEVTASSTALHALSDALLYLTAYPYECTEQIASRVLAVVALRDVLDAFEAEGLPDPRALSDSLERDLGRLAEMQNRDGGFSFWGPVLVSSPFVSVHAAHALARAGAKGFPVREEVLQRAAEYLTRIESVIPGWWPPDTKQAVIAYALYVRDLMGDRDTAGARALIRQRRIEDAPLEVLAWALPVLADDAEYAELGRAILRQFQNRGTEEAGTAHFITGYGESSHLILHSRRRTDAVVLDALVGDQPESDLIPKLVRGLLGHRTKGRWLDTQENVFALLALGRYFDAVEGVEPDFIARVWLGDSYAGDHAFRGRTTDRLAVEVPMAWLVRDTATRDLAVQMDGEGRLYYRVGMRYAPASLELAPAEEGFAVERVYEAVDDSSDVRRENDGTWIVRAGARVRVRLTLAAPGRRYHAALVDPLPAGLEPLNPELRGSDAREPPSAARGRRGRRWWAWYDHVALRDDRAEVFASLLLGGVYTYTYLARATTPGAFVVPPPRAEEMYQPETFGRGATDRMIIRRLQ